MFSSADFLQLIHLVLQTFFHIIFNSQDAVLFWVIVLLLGMQDMRMQKSKEAWFGNLGEPVWQHTVMAVASGLLGGLLGSFLMVFVGIDIGEIGIAWLWPLAIFLMLIHPRFLCFSYAGGLISLSYILLGVPKVNVSQLMALVALLHMVEAFLIFISGHIGASPVYIRNKAGKVIGAFNLQKLWPIPIVALVVLNIPLEQLAGSPVHTPDWWPLIKPAGDAAPGQLVHVLYPLIAALGYGDMAAVSRPKEKSRKSAIYLLLFSLLLMGLSVFASYHPGAAIFAALFSPLGHDLLIWLGQREELRGKPLYVHPEQGVRILDVYRSSPAAQLGLASGDVVLYINGREVHSKPDFLAALEESWGVVEMEWQKYPSLSYRKDTVRKSFAQDFGVILAPDDDARPMVEFSDGGILLKWLKKMWRT